MIFVRQTSGLVTLSMSTIIPGTRGIILQVPVRLQGLLGSRFTHGCGLSLDWPSDRQTLVPTCREGPREGAQL